MSIFQLTSCTFLFKLSKRDHSNHSPGRAVQLGESREKRRKWQKAGKQRGAPIAGASRNFSSEMFFVRGRCEPSVANESGVKMISKSCQVLLCLLYVYPPVQGLPFSLSESWIQTTTTCRYGDSFPLTQTQNLRASRPLLPVQVPLSSPDNSRPPSPLVLWPQFACACLNVLKQLTYTH